jgi:thermitase
MERVPGWSSKQPLQCAFVAIGAALAITAFPSEDVEPASAAAIQAGHVPGRLLVMPRAGLDDDELARALNAHGARRTQIIDGLGIHVVELPEQANERAVARALANTRRFKSVELDLVHAPVLLPNDPSYGSQWHHPKMNTPGAWDRSTAAGTVIAILDSGVDATHPDLAGAMVSGWNTYSNNSDTRDVYGHGTKVAGAAAAIGNNRTGVAGVAFNARIMPMRVTDTSGYAYSSTLAKALSWAADNGARVANMSFANVTTSSTVVSAAQYFRGKGGVVVAAAGNSGALTSNPATDAITSVAATGSTDGRASWSSYGSYVDVSAPGVGIWSTTRGGGYASVSGTSFASPVTAGVYALMIGVNRSLAPATLDKILTTTAVDLGGAGWDQYYGWGRVNAGAAVVKAQQTAAVDSQSPSVSIRSPTSGTVTAFTPVDVSATDNVGVVRVELYAGSTLVAADTLAPFAFSWDTRKYVNGSITLQARAYDAAGNSRASSQVTVRVAN